MTEWLEPKACPQCGATAGSTLACLACGKLLEEGPDADHFARLGVSPFDPPDDDALELAYLRLSRLLHPDFQGDADEATQQLAVSHSASLNHAYNTLRDEQARHEYLLELFHPGSLEKHKTLDPAFLMEAMEVNEELEQAHEDGCADTVNRIASMARSEITDRMADVAAACSATFQRIAGAESHTPEADAEAATDTSPTPRNSGETSAAPRAITAHWDTAEIATLLHQARVYRRILRDSNTTPPRTGNP
ncbi:MAG: hypothetical protein DHS20C15_08700 [Planctomycetota bacterium]|nr:MAG: hypothetical protein DHS20C15_08700 [Planctomycetota bacterium]